MATRKRPLPNPLDPDSDSDASSGPTSKKRPFQQKPPTTTTTTTTTTPPPQPANDDDEDDYMNMTIAEPSAPETFSQRKKRLQLEAEIRARPKSKAELAALAKARRDAALATSLLDTKTPSKGLLMMRKMGFTPGSALGAPPPPPATATSPATATATTSTATSTATATAKPTPTPTTAILEPLSVTPKPDRTGIGHASAQRAKLAPTPTPTTTTTTTATTTAQLSPEDYRARVASEQSTRRREAQLLAAQKLAEQFGSESERDGGVRTVPLRAVNVLWRGLVARREAAERESRMRYELLQSVDTPRVPGCARDCELDAEDKVALGITAPGLRRLGDVVEDEEEEGEEGGDSELEREEARGVGERLAALCEYLRREYRYCFWCKCRYEDAEMEGCPGVEEDLHG